MSREPAVRLRLKYVHRDVDRYGNVRFYYRLKRGAPKIRLPDDDESPEFLRRYQELRDASPAEVPPAAIGRTTLAPNTFRWLVVEFLKSPRYKQLGGSSRTYWRQVLDSMMQEPIHQGSAETFATFPLTRLNLKALKILRDRKQGLPAAANYRVKVLRQLFKWAVDEEHVLISPASDLRTIKHASDGHHTWTPEEVAKFEERHPVGTKARLALALMLWTGLRRSDVVRLGRQHLRDGHFRLTLAKNKDRKPVIVDLPLLPELQKIIVASPCGDLTYLVTDHGQPFTVAGFGNWFRGRCIAANVPGRAHGLRKAGAVTAVENGASTQQLMAIFGWETLKEVERYTKAANRRKLADAAMKLLVRKV